MDPFSVTASAAGLVSLGITVSDGLVQYCRTYQSREAELAQLTQHAEHLRSFLNIIETQCPGSQDSSGNLQHSLRNCRDACTACIEDFERLNAKYAHARSSMDFWGQGRTLARRIRYPFDKEKFERLRSQLQEFNTRLLCHLQLANIDLTQDLKRATVSDVARLESTIQSVGSQLLSSASVLAPSISDAIQVHLEGVSHSVQAGLSNQSVSITGGQERQTSALIQHLDRCFELQQKQIHDILESMMQAPIVHPTISDRISQLEESNSDLNYAAMSPFPMATHEFIGAFCTCSAAHKAQASRSNLRLRHSGVKHQRGCISFNNREENNITWSFRFLQCRITTLWYFEYTQGSWFRGLRISPSLTFRATVPRCSPAFREIYSTMWEMKLANTEMELESVAKSCLLRLQQIFASGRAHPTDVVYGDFNLLHLSASVMDLNDSIKNSWAIILRFLGALIEMGVPLNDINTRGRTPLDFKLTGVSHESDRGPIINGLLNMNAEISTLRYVSEYISTLRFVNPCLSDPLGCKKLTYMVFRRSEPEIIPLLRADRFLMYELTGLGQTPLHLAVLWQKGLSTLIEYGGEVVRNIINIRDTWGMSALDYAVHLEEADSVQLLCDAGASVTSSTCRYCKKNAAQYPRMSDVLIEAFSRQRKELLSFALGVLPAEYIEKLELWEYVHRDAPLDGKAFDVTEALKHLNISIPTIFDGIEPGSQYHWIWVEACTAQKLWDAGFHDINSTFRGYTPLMTTIHHAMSEAQFLECICWYKEHGVNIYAPIPTPSRDYRTFDDTVSEPTYSLAHYLSDISGYLDFYGRKVEKASCIPRLIEHNITDTCECYCTTKGCTLVSKYVKGYFRWFDEIDLNEEMYLARLVNEFGAASSHPSAMEAIRSMSFTKLGMKHTCCGYRHHHEGWKDILKNGLLELMDHEEIEEIRDEDRSSSVLLNALMREFDNKFQELGLPLVDFVKQYWWPRVKEVKTADDLRSKEYLQAVREIGVILEGVEDKEEE
ncbi:uncharacterized protein F4822DRAFT_366603 [Hypoxylon trugodes]|uniref:uncharacterized protein n=1 Tax=Hypoxylon trugodes TaxID=326681 RepID=UPI00218E7680|nr:uncharacterized protein F4822DRAFT_366603 [Hypoxylon trugodes]KAI1384548.1 hypothetical protein F4822DRAFT_366603 [Hypoxylon trugodes]